MKTFNITITTEKLLVAGAYISAFAGMVGGFMGKMTLETNYIVFGVFLLALAILERVRNPKLPDIHFTAVNLGDVAKDEGPAEPAKDETKAEEPKASNDTA